MALDIDRFQELVAPLRTDDLDIEYGFVEQPLSADVLRCLRYMHDIEMHTVCYLRDLLVTSAHRNPDLTTFLTFWSFEEYWHGEAIGRVLAAHGEQAGRPRVRTLRRARRLREATSPIVHMTGSAIAGSAMTAVHMTWGALNEWTTQAGYARLATLADHPVLTPMLRRIMKQEGRHIDFYAGEARLRLEGSAGARRMTRWALRRSWEPVGSDVMPVAEVRHLIQFLFGGPAGAVMIERIDRRVDSLPGLAGLSLGAHASFKYSR